MVVLHPDLPARLGHDLHRQLAEFNQRRLHPGRPGPNLREEAQQALAMQLRELDFLEQARAEAEPTARLAPQTPLAFVSWFESLRDQGPGQHDPLFPWLAETCTFGEMRWFIAQEVAGEAGFEDLVAMCQVKMPITAKLEMARNYWDEMGRGHAAGMHGPLLANVAHAFELVPGDTDLVVEARILSNLMMGLACNRSYAYHAIGALGVIELTAPDRVAQVARGLARLGLSASQRRYFDLHAALDPSHSRAWNREVLVSLLEADPDSASALAEGALMRLQAGARCYQQYRRQLGCPSRNTLAGEAVGKTPN